VATAVQFRWSIVKNHNMRIVDFNINLKSQIQSVENGYTGRYKVQTRDGKPVRVICWDKKDKRDRPYPIVGLRANDDTEFITTWMEDGKYDSITEFSINDLVLVDTLEPKFKVGDWIADDNGNSYYIFNVSYHIVINGTLEDGYLAERCSSIEQVFISFEDENKYHLWTTADAKEGDVLTNDIGDMCIFKEMLSQDAFYPYCYITKDIITEWDTKWVFTNACCNALWYPHLFKFKPSTRKEKDFFFRLMEASGYEWDKENKTLKRTSKEEKTTIVE